MNTYQDLLAIGDNETQRISFVKTAIAQYQASELYKTAKIAYDYNRHKNVTITQYQRLLYKITGEAVPDKFGSSFKMACRHFHRFVVQETQTLLGNGITWENEDTAEKLGNNQYPIDTQIQNAGKAALIGGVAYGFYNLDHIDVFSALEFVPLYDEENGSLMAGIRYWQIEVNKPLRATLYEIDGYTDYLWKNGEASILHKKRTYKLNITSVPAEGTEVFNGENYPSFPIIPLWGNSEHQSEIVGLREQIDCYDLIKSGFANTVDEASIVYWTIQNAGGMDDLDLAQFVERMKTIHAATVDGGTGATAESHTQEAPYASREALLDRLDRDLYRDAMALNTQDIAAGAVTATQIRAAYEPLNAKLDDFEYCVLSFLKAILSIAGIEDNPTFTRSIMINATEEITSLTMAAQFLPAEYVTTRILSILGDADKTEDILKQMDAEEVGLFE